jgi:hypothetical protein
VKRREPASPGKPHCHWVKTSHGSGWVVPGRPVTGSPKKFWERLQTAAEAITGHHPSTVHSVGPGILVAGSFALPLLDGRAVQLLETAMRYNPADYCMAMVPVVRDVGVCVRVDEGGARLVSDGREVSGADDFEAVVRGKGLPKDLAKARQRRWVLALHDFLARHPRVSDAWARFWLAASAGPALREFLGVGASWEDRSLMTTDTEELRAYVLLLLHWRPLLCEQACRQARSELSGGNAAHSGWKLNAVRNYVREHDLAMADRLDSVQTIIAPWRVSA